MKRDEALKTLGRRIATLRREKGLTQEELKRSKAKLVGQKVSPAAIFVDFTFSESRRTRR